jgi:hypothetical protein
MATVSQMTKVLTDGSKVFDVLLTDQHGETVSFACFSEESQEALAYSFVRSLRLHAIEEVTEVSI